MQIPERFVYSLKPIGLWGQRHKRYLQEHKRAFYTTLLTSGKLNSYLADIDEQAQVMFFRLVRELKKPMLSRIIAK